MTYGHIYAITNDINNKKYVGKTKDSIEQRFKEHQLDAIRLKDKNRTLYNAINKYGITHFFIKELETCPIEQLSSRKQYWIKKLDSFNNGYNQTYGGDGSILYDYNLFIQDYLNGMLIGEIANKYNCCIDTVSDALKEANIDGTVNAKLRQKTIPIIQLTLDNCKVQEFHSCMEAAHWIFNNNFSNNTDLSGISSNILTVARSQNKKTAYGYKWQLKNEKDNIPKTTRSVKCIETNKIFPSLQAAAKWCGLKDSSGISAVCNGRQKSAGKHPDTKEKLHWKYI